MARTKQTARKALVQLVPRRQLVAEKIARKSAPAVRGGENQGSDSDESISNVVNTQQFSLKFDDQDKCEKKAIQTNMHKCKNCQAYLTCQSTLLTQDQYTEKKKSPTLSDIQTQKYLQNYQKVWICQFCLSHNSIPSSYELPKEENPCIILEKKSKNKQDIKQGDGKMLIFCVDISGSMDMSFSGKTRLQSVKEAILDEVNRIMQQKEKIKIGLITFGSEVNLIGDGSAFKEQKLPIQLYKDFDGVVNHLSKVKNFCYPIEKSYNSMKKAISGLAVYGSTALGPGLLSAVELASKGSVGSKIILCTDGEANVGMGGSFNDDRFTFYNKMAQHAKKKKVMVNILSLKGDNCNLKQLGKLSLATGGSILKIDPKMLGTQFAKIVKQNVIGTESRLIIKLNKIFRICNGSIDEVSKDKSTMTQDFGNFTEQTELNFQFQTIPKQQGQKISQIDQNLYKCSRVPMQVQLTYTGRNNWKYLQIVTDWRQLTQNLDDIYEGANFSLFAASVLQRASKKIRQNQFKEAESILTGYWSIVKQKFQKTQNKADLDRFAERVKKLQKILNSKVKKSGGQTLAKKRESSIGGSRGGNQRRGRGRGVRGRSRSGSRDRNTKRRSRSRSASSELMQSDSQNEVLFKQMRARQRSRSVDRRKSSSSSSSSSSSEKNMSSQSQQQEQQKPIRGGRKNPRSREKNTQKKQKAVTQPVGRGRTRNQAKNKTPGKK